MLGSARFCQTKKMQHVKRFDHFLEQFAGYCSKNILQDLASFQFQFFKQIYSNPHSSLNLKYSWIQRVVTPSGRACNKVTKAEFSHDEQEILKPDQKTENISNELQKFIHNKDIISYLEAALMCIKYAPVQTRKGIYHHPIAQIFPSS